MFDKTNIAGIASLVVLALTAIGELIRFVGPLFGYVMGAAEAQAVDQLANVTFGLAVGAAAVSGGSIAAQVSAVVRGGK